MGGWQMTGMWTFLVLNVVPMCLWMVWEVGTRPLGIVWFAIWIIMVLLSIDLMLVHAGVANSRLRKVGLVTTLVFIWLMTVRMCLRLALHVMGTLVTVRA